MQTVTADALRDEMWRRIQALLERGTPQQLAEYQTEDGIIRFVREILGVKSITSYQEDILRAFVRTRRVAVRGPHGLGKSTTAAWAVLWAMSVFPTDVKVVTTASVWRQLEHYLWPEIHKWARGARWDLLGMEVREGKELLQLSLKIKDREAFAAASDNPSYIEGAHASVVFFIFDEAKAIPDPMWDAAEGAFSQAGVGGRLAFALAISTPAEPSGRFYDIHSRKRGFEDWWTRHVTLEEAVRAGQISAEWAEQKRIQWGEESPAFQNRVLGEFSTHAENTVIPLSWIEAATERWLEQQGVGVGKESIGVDVARFGEDRSAIVRMVGRTMTSLEYVGQRDAMEIAGRVAQMANKKTPIGVDSIGVGAGVVDRLREQGYNVIPINTATSTDMTDVSGELFFLNLRSAMWWMMRDGLDPTNPYPIAIIPDDELIGELVAPRWRLTSRGAIQIESKDEIRKRLKRSTDGADALGHALLAQMAPVLGQSLIYEENLRVTIE